MNIRCFECDALLEADDADAAARALVAHFQEKHAGSYPEQTVRTLALNFVAATERLTGPTERLPEIGEVTIHPVIDDRAADWLQLFDHDGFAGNPDWASCYCLESHEPPASETPTLAWRDRRAAMEGRIRCGATYGYLAYVDGRVAGWVNASFRSEYGLFRQVDPGGPDPRSVIGVSCFVIAPPFRRHGVASALLDRVIADAPARGAKWIEGYPHNDRNDGDAGHFRGPRAMYEARGFRAIEVLEHYTVVRRQAG